MSATWAKARATLWRTFCLFCTIDMARRRATKHHFYKCGSAFNTEAELRTHKQQQHKTETKTRLERGRVKRNTPRSPKNDHHRRRSRKCSLAEDESDYNGKAETTDQYLDRVAKWAFGDDFESDPEFTSQDSLQSEARGKSTQEDELERAKPRRWYSKYGLGWRLGGRAITHIPLHQLSELGKCALGRHNRSK
jgi:hypothetical protein